MQGLPPLPQSQNGFVGQSAFPRLLGANDFSGSSGQSIGGSPPLNGSGRLLNTGNLYSPGPAVSSPQSLNPAAMPANLRAGTAYEPQAMSLPQKRRRGPGPWVIIGIGLLIIVLIGGSITTYLLLGLGNTPQTTATSSPTTNGTPLFTDAFTNNNNGWNLQGDPGKFSASVGNGAMVLEDDNHSLLWELVPGQKTFSNFKLVVDAMLSKGDQNNGYGVFIRGSSNQNSELATYYRFALYGDGSYAIFKGSVDANGNTTNTRLQDYALDPAIKKSGLNHIIIVANGPAMTFIVNGQALKTVTDNSYTSGSVALFVINLNPSKTGGQATFSNFGIYQLKP
ncbi:MAG TPA: family 16 glycoside hydrolase [Ktedonobacteraceae bacterium]|nr:family 16 glycoside hydrolase [Ktedonobacteraceae bacterium]